MGHPAMCIACNSFSEVAEMGDIEKFFNDNFFKKVSRDGNFKPVNRFLPASFTG